MERIPDGSGLVPVPLAARLILEDKPVLVRQRLGPAGTKVAGWFGASGAFRLRLDPLGVATWHLLDGKKTLREIRGLLARSHPHEPDLSARLGRFIGVLVSHRMVRLDAPPLDTPQD